MMICKEQENVNMEKKVLQEKVIQLFDFILSLYTAVALVVIIGLHTYVSFFPILFLFDFCILLGHPLFLRFVLKKRWFDCRKSKILTLKYIIIPWAVMDTVVMSCYPDEVVYVLQNNFF